MIRLSLTLATLCACLATTPALSAGPHTTASPATPAAGARTDTGLIYDAQTGTFTEPVPPEGGWQAFANLLDKITPSVNTSIPLTPSQVTSHIAALTDAGKPQAALKLIEQRSKARAESGAIGTDVQLEYQRGRALDALGEHDQAMAVWRQMTTDFPELPEPWNALAIEYARRGSLEQARDALNMALVSVPNFAPALENLGRVQTQLAQESFARARAARPGQPAAAQPASAHSPAKGGTKPQPAAQ
ncbi:MAG: tetratricopeptide repeat protein [Castellaniella sp.]|uniref:tetratricopeptide repeat protein n=1 Tax=Castellaniella sp. TaxID=1955812 RepID=UPI001223F0F9|nr:tetratricopeptide repeat protein [Castellaniella sp.]TAN30169.1 MAG: tetratricopeptide repeat protein [Castellaniella sp.]